MIRRIIVLGMVILLSLVVAACYSPVHPKSDTPDPAEDAGGSLNLSFGTAARSTILPVDPDEYTIANYKVNGTGPDSSSFDSGKITGATYTKAGLAPGTWTIVVQAFNSVTTSAVIYEKTLELTILPDQTTIAVVALDKKSGTGTLSMIISWGSAGAYDEISGTITPEGGAASTLVLEIATDGKSASYAGPRAAGNYDINLILRKDGTELGTLREAAQIFAGYTSSASYDRSADLSVTGITLDIISTALTVSRTLQLTATVSPVNAADKSISWSTSNEAVAGVSATGPASGLVTAHANGMATITVTTNDGNKTATCVVTIANPGTGVIVIQPAPTQARLFTKVGTTTRLAIGLGMSLPYNTWTPWEITSTDALWFPIVAEAGKTYSVQWDDSYEGSLFEGTTKNYSGDIQLGLYQNDKATRVSGWSLDTDSGYLTAKTFTMATTQLVYIKVMPFHDDPEANQGSFALKVSEGSSTNPDQGFAWYKNGVLIEGATDYTYTVDPVVFTSGKHRITVMASRGGALFSETYTFSK